MLLLNEVKMDDQKISIYEQMCDNNRYLVAKVLKNDKLTDEVIQKITHLDKIDNLEVDHFEVVNLDLFLSKLSDFSSVEEELINNYSINSLPEIELIRLKNCVIEDNLIALNTDIYYKSNLANAIVLFSVKTNVLDNVMTIIQHKEK